MVATNNIFANNSPMFLIDTSQYTFNNNLVSQDTLFYNAAVFNYQLAIGSPAIDSATGDLVPPQDNNNISRPIGNGYDLGAFEFDSNYVPPAVPKEPFNLKATVLSYNSIAISWQDSSSNVNGYKIEVKWPGEADFAERAVKDVHVKHDTLKLLVPASAYSIRVVSYNLGGHSEPSNTVTVTTENPPLLPAPEGMAVSINGPGQIKLWWKPLTYADGYVIERKKGDSTFMAIDTVDAGTRAYNDTGLLAATAYTYRIYAFNVSGQSDYSAEVSGTTDSAVSTGFVPLQHKAWA
ncbi:MAG: fibronectin type III domain-containing protein [Bacteroidales bacterium]|nr:fibronectin type III domain-containing protein [Bacteroidales bacterium]